MAADANLIERIYEAAAVPSEWPNVLEHIAAAVGAFGVCFVYRSPQQSGWTLSERMTAFAEEYVAEGWIERDDRVPPVVAEHFPGFRCDADYWTEDRAAELPIYRDFLLPRGMRASAATALQGARDDALHVGVEGLASYAAARNAIPKLDAFRPHLARAISLTVKLSQARLEASVAALQSVGMPAAVISRDGRLRAANDRFVRRVGPHADTRRGRLLFASRFVQSQLDTALSDLGQAEGIRSIAIRPREGEQPFALHLLPLWYNARDMFESDGVLVMVAEAANASVPASDLLRLLFDLTPAEARLARHLVDGHTPSTAAASLDISEHTARTHLRHIFLKTGVNRQGDLVRLLCGLGAPASLVEG